MFSSVKVRMVIALAAIAIVASISAPAPAAGAATCQLVATVTLSQPENLLQVDGGSGSLSTTFVCEGSIAGTALLSPGTFQFCKHTSAAHTVQCTTAPDQTVSEPVADGLGRNEGPVVAHVKGSITMTLNTGVSCSMSLNGHSYLVHADIDIVGMSCSNGFVATTGRADASAQIIVNPLLDCPAGPGGAKACFNTLTFAGKLVAVQQ